MNKLYSQFGPESTIKEIRKLLAAVENDVVDDKAPSELLKQANPDNSEKTDDGDSDTEIEDGVEDDPIPAIANRLVELEQSVNQLSDYISKFQDSTDRAMLPLLETTISNMNLDYKSAYELTTFYTKGWFSRSFMSPDGKRAFAEFLYNTVEPYCKSNLETFRMIRDRDPDISLFIAYPRSGS